MIRFSKNWKVLLKSIMENKNITINDLAIMVKKGFDGVDVQFIAVHQKFDNIDKKFELVDRRFEHIDKRFEHIDDRFDAVEERLERIEKVILDDHRQRIEKLEMEVFNLKNAFAVK